MIVTTQLPKIDLGLEMSTYAPAWSIAMHSPQVSVHLRAQEVGSMSIATVTPIWESVSPINRQVCGGQSRWG